MPAAAELSLYRTRCEAVSLSAGVVLDGLVSGRPVFGRSAPPEAEATTANTVPAAAPVAATLSARFRSRLRRFSDELISEWLAELEDLGLLAFRAEAGP